MLHGGKKLETDLLIKKIVPFQRKGIPEGESLGLAYSPGKVWIRSGCPRK